MVVLSLPSLDRIVLALTTEFGCEHVTMPGVVHEKYGQGSLRYLQRIDPDSGKTLIAVLKEKGSHVEWPAMASYCRALGLDYAEVRASKSDSWWLGLTPDESSPPPDLRVPVN